ncbi:MAG: MBL fold metallo-hydrolase [Nitrososphaerales archaeon]
MEVKVLGGAREVGRSAFLVRGNTTRILLDFGVLIHKTPAFPIHIQRKDVDAVLLSHAHLDHSGAIPLLFFTSGVKVYATDLTFDLTKLLIEDFLKVSGFYLPFEYIELINMMRNTININYNERFKVGEFEITFLEAGHIAGGASIIIENGGKRLLYTGDLNVHETQLLRGAVTEFGELDFVITESTYALTDHPPRKDVEREFVNFAKEVVERGGTLLVPAFAVGRSQEIACVLKSANFPYRIAMDGMALKVNDIHLNHPEYLRDPNLLRKSLEDIEFISSWSERRRIAKTPSVIISPAGMLGGGAAVFYNSEVAKNSKNAIAIVSYQVADTPGRTLLDKGLALVNGKLKKVKAEIKRFDFSSHSGRTDLFKMFEKIKGNPKIITIHGDERACVNFAEELKERFGLDAIAPKPGDTFIV